MGEIINTWEGNDYQFDHGPHLNLPGMVGVGESIISGEPKTPIRIQSISKQG